MTCHCCDQFLAFANALRERFERGTDERDFPVGGMVKRMSASLAPGSVDVQGPGAPSSSIDPTGNIR